jgi:hypothetical protein
VFTEARGAPLGHDLLREGSRLLRELADDVERLSSDVWFHRMLHGMARMRSYGVSNLILISHQCPTATWVRGHRQWEKLGRRLRPDAKPIWIVAPSRPRQPWPFYAVKVYDVEQTEGPDLPDLRLSYAGDPETLPRLEAAAARLGLAIEPLPLLTPPEMLGAQHERRVLVREGLSPLARCRVLAHEYAHALLHPEPPLPPHAVLEAEADATAWFVLQSLGISFPSPAYIASHVGSGKTVLASMRRIRAASRAIIEAVEGRTPSARIPALKWQPRNPISHRISRFWTYRPRKRPRVLPFGRKNCRNPFRESPPPTGAAPHSHRPGETP